MPHRSSFTLHTAFNSSGAVLTLGGQLDLTSAPGLGPALDDALAQLRQTAGPTLTLDMAGVEFLDIAAARVIAAAVGAWPGPHQVVIRDPNPLVRRLLQISGLSEVIRLEESTSHSRPGDGARPAPPDGQQPDGQLPDGQQPDGQQPDGQQPNGQQSDGQLGPRQLAALLHTPVADLYRAGELGLLPGRDPSGHWSPDGAAEIVRSWPQTAEAVTAARELGAARGADLLAQLTGLPVTAAHVAELAARGLLTSPRSYKNRPLYRVADLNALAADPTSLELLTQITTPSRELRR